MVLPRLPGRVARPVPWQQNGRRRRPENRSYTTSTVAVANSYPDGYAAKLDFDGGYLDPAMDFAKEAEAAGAYGETVRDPAEVGPALRRGLEQTRAGKPA